MPEESPDNVYLFPLSFAQQRLWFLDRFEPDSAVFNIAVAYRIKGPLEVEVMERSLGEIVRRHEVLRTTFRAFDGEPRQVISPRAEVELPVVDLHHLAADEREARAIELANEEASRPFDLSKGPLLRAFVVRLVESDHVFVLNMHHIVSDAWSMGLFWRELVTLYNAFGRGEPSPLEELQIQYADFAQWQREWLRGEVLEEQLSYWRGALGDGTGVTELPADRPRPAVQKYRGKRLAVRIPLPLAGRLRGLCSDGGYTLFMVLLAGFKVLLSRYSGSEDVVVGTPIANRNRAELEGLIGFFVNTLVLRTDLSGDPAFRDLLVRVRETALGAYAHQDVPFEKLVDELEPERDMSHTPLFQVMFSMQNVSSTGMKLSGLTAIPIPLENYTAKYDLSMSLVDAPNEISGWLEYNSGIFDEETVARLIVHYKTLLEGIVSDPDMPVSRYPLLTRGERERLVVEWNDTAVEYRRGVCVHEEFEERAADMPEAVAVECGGERLCYGELNDRANRLARYLGGLGVGVEDVVGLYMERSIEVVVGILGILKAGAAYVPLDVAYPRERVEYMVRDAGVRVLLTQERLRGELPADGVAVVCVDGGWDEIAVESGENPGVGVDQRNLVYVIYTSGSTGQPKGVMIEHGGLTNLVNWHRRVYEVTERDRVTQVCVLSFDLSVWELFPCITAGARLLIADEETRLSPQRLVNWLAAEGVTLCILPTPVAEAVLEEQWPEKCSMRSVLAAGDKLHRAPREAIPFRLYNNYGPTESTVLATWAAVPAGEGDGSPPPIGRPLDNMKVYLLDRHFNPVPVGVTGELYIAGAGLGRGYLGRPDLTAELFVPDPFDGRDGDRMYRTGDLARYRANGDIEYRGRMDGQVKIRGYRVELGEVEAVLGGHSKVREAVVRVWGDGAGGKHLVGYVVPRDRDDSPGISELKGYLKEKLPEYMVPPAFMTLESLPLTPNGKIDRSALPEPDGVRPELEEVFVAPRSDLEEDVASLWQEVLNVDKVGVHDNFFDLGGNSLLLIQVNVRLHEMLGKNISMIDMFRYPTIDSLCRFLVEEVMDGPSFDASLDKAKARRNSTRRRKQLK